MEMPIVRICKKCGVGKKLDDFSKNKKCKYGRTHTCRKCNRKIHCLFISKNIEKVKKWKREDYRKWYQKNKNNQNYIKKRKEVRKKYKINNSDVVKRYRKRHYEKQKINLTNSYVKHLIVEKSGLKWSDIPQELVEIKRKQLKLKRNAKE